MQTINPSYVLNGQSPTNTGYSEGPTISDILACYQSLQIVFSRRNEDYKTLRRQYFGDLRVTAKRTKAVSETQEEMLTVYNLVNASLKRYLAALVGATPSVKAMPRRKDTIELDLAARRTKWLRNVWSDNDLEIKYGQMIWLQSLLGMAPIKAIPTGKKASGFKISVLIPEFCYFKPKDEQEVLCLASYKPRKDEFRNRLINSGFHIEFLKFYEDLHTFAVLCKKGGEDV